MGGPSIFKWLNSGPSAERFLPMGRIDTYKLIVLRWLMKEIGCQVKVLNDEEFITNVQDRHIRNKVHFQGRFYGKKFVFSFVVSANETIVSVCLHVMHNG